MSEQTVIEINGVKMEIDLRHAKRIDHMQVGDRVKVLTKGYSDYTVSAGVVIGFEPFENLPTIIIAYVETSYSAAGIKFLYFNANTKETEVIKAIDNDQLDIDKSSVIEIMDREIAKKQAEVEDLKAKQNYFLNHFQSYWAPVSKPEPEPAA